MARDENMGHQLAGGNSSWFPELESWTTHHLYELWYLTCMCIGGGNEIDTSAANT